MKTKLILSFFTVTLVTKNAFAQTEMFGSFAKDMQQEIEGLFPYILGLVFIISALFNSGKFFGEDRDIKKGITNILIFVGGALLIMGIYKYVTSLTL